ncbi:sugar phosphate isomerase/epimerase family protein [Alicyclobacillus ferrooxydans]|uniref:Sugar phosphate isomerase n=1 Tax=Alicyclobacillus ferrooxydans TaxID=471514 RepID=A0A0P9CVY2_9BACL|nr:sugar phosphate isomerase/epimerase [Alicyclobacillus ferrooxydans]KPV43928.1 sugar phosphate isomerase [Alicyclobacillus ferrooxydans]
MKLGVSTYSLYRAIQHGEMTVLDVFAWTSENGGEHVEIVPMGFSLHDDLSLVEQILQKSLDTGLDISNYAISANFSQPTEKEFYEEVERVQNEVEIAHRLGVKRMRHDVSWRPIEETSTETFEYEFPMFVEACQEIADYASQYGIVTSIENHGYYVQSADRVQRIVKAVNRWNFRTTLDVGNFLCVDESPYISVKKNLSLASMVHLKDFHVRSEQQDPNEGWFRSVSGTFLRGAILGQGDLHLREIMTLIKASDYDGYLSIEFEGLEECKFGTYVSLANAIRMWSEC